MYLNTNNQDSIIEKKYKYWVNSPDANIQLLIKVYFIYTIAKCN